ncbi:MAG: hypothetical protein O6951_00980 [Actinobacteria bacterium]|nr:hypothetical protein [Actinomycetota bacterium]
MNPQTDQIYREAQGGRHNPMESHGRRSWRRQVRAVAPMVVMVLVVAACSSSDDDASPATTVPPPASTTTTATTEAPTTTTTPATTQEAPTTSSEPTKVYDGSGCTYDGETEFALNSEVTFTFINESDDTGVGFVVWTVPDGITAEEIDEKGIFEAIGTEQGNTAPYEFWEAKFPPTQLDTEYQVTVTLDRAGLYSVNCFVETGAPVNTHYATIITVSG